MYEVFGCEMEMAIWEGLDWVEGCWKRPLRAAVDIQNQRG
jgi:hypothetical protein